MSTIIPSPLSGLGEGVETAIALIQRRREREEERRLREQQLALEDRRTIVAEHTAALNTINNVLQLSQGRAIADMPFIHDQLRMLLPGSDPADRSPTGLGSIVADPQTTQEVLQPQINEYASRLRDLDPDTFEQIATESISSAVGARTATRQERQLARSQTQIHLDALESLRRDPNMLSSVARNLIGDERVRVRDPRTGEVLEYESASAASLASTLMQIYSNADLQRARLEGAGRDQRLEIAKNLQTMLREANPDSPIALTQALRATNAYVDGNVNQLLSDPEVPASTKVAIRALNEGFQVAQTGLDAIRQQFPEQVQQFDILTGLVKQAESLPVDRREAFINQQINFLEDLGINVTPLRDPTVGESIFSFLPGVSRPAGRGTPAARTSPADTSAIIEQAIPRVQAPFSPGAAAIGQGAAPGGSAPGMFDPRQMAAQEATLFIQRATELAQGLASGEVTLQQVREQVGNDAETLKAIVQMAERLRGGAR